MFGAQTPWPRLGEGGAGSIGSESQLPHLLAVVTLGESPPPSLSLHFVFCKMGRMLLSSREAVRIKLNGSY